MAGQSLATVSRAKIFRSEEFAPMKEALIVNNQQRGGKWNPLAPLRALEFRHFFDRKNPKALQEGVLNPDLPEILHSEFGIHVGEYSKSMSEAVQIPSNLVALKVADLVVEGTEPYSQWKEYIRVVDMPTPLYNVPKDKYTDWLGHDDFEKFRATDAEPVDMGGKSEAVALNCEDNNGYYRAKVGIRRNDIRDNKFLAIEQNLKNAGAAWYYALGKKIVDFYSNTSTFTNTATRASLDLATSIHSELEALVNVIRNKFPGTQLNRADTGFMHPTNAYQTVVKSTGASGIYPFLDNRMLAPNDEDVINNSGMARALGLKRVFETPQATSGKVVIIKRDIAGILGLYQDLEIENFDMTVSGLVDSALSMRLDIQKAHNDGAFVITSF